MDRLPPTFDGRLRVENRYDFTDLAQVRFEWRLATFAAPDDPTTGPTDIVHSPSIGHADLARSPSNGHTDIAHGTAAAPAVAPGNRGTLEIPLPNDWKSADALYLTARNALGHEIHTWTWMTKSPEDIRRRVVATGGRAGGQETAGRIQMEASGTRVTIDRATGQLAEVVRDGKPVSLTNGPRILEGVATLTSLTHRADGDGYVVEATYDGTLKQVRWRLDGSGWLQLDYRYVNPGRHAYLGVSFDYPEAQVTGMKWLGRGPYRVWKNRREGASFDVWQKPYNDTRTGADWTYPEFKGHHADLYWARIQTRELPITVVTDTEDLFLRLLTPKYGVNPTFTAVPFPEGDLSFLHAIAPIGTKFAGPETMGPEGQPNESVGENATQHMGAYEARLYFYFGG